MARKDNKAFGTQRERQVRDYYRDLGYIAFRAPASLGVADVIAIRSFQNKSDAFLLSDDFALCSEVIFCEVKGGIGSPYKHFGPDKRERLMDAAAQAGAQAVLIHWASRHPMEIIPSYLWPET